MQIYHPISIIKLVYEWYCEFVAYLLQLTSHSFHFDLLNFPMTSCSRIFRRFYSQNVIGYYIVAFSVCVLTFYLSLQSIRPLQISRSRFNWAFSSTMGNRNMHTDSSSGLPDSPKLGSQTDLYHGSCHCGYLKYSASFALSKDSSYLQKCNCSICRKAGYALLSSEPKSSFKIISPNAGVSALSDYTFHTNLMHHYFCPHCGIRCFLVASFSSGGEESSEVFVNAGTIDGKTDGSRMEDLGKLRSKYINGKAEAWSVPPADTPYEGGLA